MKTKTYDEIIKDVCAGTEKLKGLGCTPGEALTAANALYAHWGYVSCPPCAPASLSAEATTLDHLKGLIEAAISFAEHGAALTKNTADDKIAATLRTMLASGGALLEFGLDYLARWIDRINAGEQLVMAVEELPANVQALNLPDPTQIFTALQYVLKLYEFFRSFWGK